MIHWRLWKFIQYTIHWDKTQMLKKKFLWTKQRLQKMLSFLFCKLQLITVLLLICNSYTSWSTWFISLKLSGEYSIFDSVSLLFNFIFLFNKKQGLIDFLDFSMFIILFKIQIGKPHTVLLPDLWFFNYNKKFENSMISAWIGAPQKLTCRTTF